MRINFIETILYVDKQQESRTFYEKLLRMQPSLDVPGMTEFQLAGNFKLGLMPNVGIAKILGAKTPHPDRGKGIPRCELYLYVDDVETEFENAIEIGASEISPVQERDWGDKVCYFSDPDGHIVALAEKMI
ncbi:Lactoylglutathione lyase [Flavobacterium longum]|uniref:VOC family protein n=1 Tax=Flavobacterium longum TaxID=1299340 RepID=UPI0039E8FEB9